MTTTTTSRITARVTNVKRHTTGFILNGNRTVTRGQAVKLAKKGLIKNVVARKSSTGSYITSLPSAKKNLSQLPVVVR